MQTSAVFPRFQRGKTTLILRLLLIIYVRICLINSNFRQFSCPNDPKKGVRAPILCRGGLFEADKTAYESHAMKLAFRQLEWLIFRVVGHDEDMFIV